MRILKYKKNIMRNTKSSSSRSQNGNGHAAAENALKNLFDDGLKDIYLGGKDINQSYSKMIKRQPRKI